MRKRILIVTNHSYMFWQFRRELAEALQKEYELVLAMPFVGHEEDFQKMGIRCIPISMNRRGVNPFAEAKLLLGYKKLLKKEAPDLVLTYSIKPNIYIGLLCRKTKIPYYANVQGLGTAFQKPVLTSLVTVLYRIAFQNVQRVFFENEENAREFRERKILSADRQVVLSGAGINLERYQMAPYPNHKRMHFLYLGRIMKEKGMDELFYAAKELQRKEVPFVLDLVGFFEDEYKEKIDKLVDAKIAVFHGFQEDPRPYYAMADCVVLPSYHEGMSNVLLEAAATGRPVITSNIPGCKEAVDDGKSGLLCETEDWNDLYRKMSKIAQMSRIEREAMGVCGRDKMTREFDKDKVVKKTIQGIERV